MQAAPQPMSAANGAANGGADYSAQWAEYYRSTGKHKEAEAIEAQMKQKVIRLICFLFGFTKTFVTVTCLTAKHPTYLLRYQLTCFLNHYLQMLNFKSSIRVV